MASRKTATFAVDDEEKGQTSSREVARPATPTYRGNEAMAPSLSEVPTKETVGADSDFGLTGNDMRNAERKLVRKVRLCRLALQKTFH
jgi:hypothetical protein